MSNVKDFATFQSAYDALPDEGGTILVPAGTYGYTSEDNKGQFRGLHITTKAVVLQGEGAARRDGVNFGPARRVRLGAELDRRLVPGAGGPGGGRSDREGLLHIARVDGNGLRHSGPAFTSTERRRIAVTSNCLKA